MPRGSNQIRVNATVELLALIEKVQQGKGEPWNLLHKSFVLMRFFLINHEKEYIELFGKDKYEKELARWTRTRVELRDLAKVKRIKKQKIEALKLKIEKIKAEAYKKQTELHQNSQLEELDEEIAIKENELKNLSTLNNRSFRRRYGEDKVRKDVENDITIEIVTLKKRREELPK